MSDQPKDTWDLGWDLIAAQPDQETENDAMSGALSAYASGYDLDDESSRAELALFFVNSMAYGLTFPSPTDEDPDPLDSPEKEAAFEKKMNSLAEHLADAYASWEAHNQGARCEDCGEEFEAEPEFKSDPSKAN